MIYTEAELCKIKIIILLNEHFRRLNGWKPREKREKCVVVAVLNAINHPEMRNNNLGGKKLFFFRPKWLGALTAASTSKEETLIAASSTFFFLIVLFFFYHNHEERTNCIP